jgi:hypothetical protein
MIKEFIQGFKKGRQITNAVKAKNYYDHVEDIPVYNFFKVAKGEYQYLYKDSKDYDKPYPEELFKIVFNRMYFQFKKLDNTYLRQKAQLEVYWSKWIVEKNYRWKNEFNTLKNKLEKEVKKELDIDDFTDYIERTFDQPVGSLDIYKVSVSKAFNNYHRAIEHNKKKQNANN